MFEWKACDSTSQTGVAVEFVILPMLSNFLLAHDMFNCLAFGPGFELDNFFNPGTEVVLITFTFQSGLQCSRTVSVTWI